MVLFEIHAKWTGDRTEDTGEDTGEDKSGVMFRFSSEEGQELTVRHARSLTRYSTDHLHSHVLVSPELEGAVHYRKETIFSIFSIFLVDNLCWTVFIPIFPAFFRPQYGFLSVGLLFSMKPLAQLCMTSLSMTAVDNLGPKTPQLLGTLLLTLALLIAAAGFLMKNIFAFSQLYVFMLVMRSIHGCGSALLLAGGLSHVTMCHPSHLQSYATMMVRFGSVVGLLLGPPLGGWMVHTHGDLESEKHENNDLWILFALLLGLSGFCLCYQFIFFHNGHSIFISNNADQDTDSNGLDILSRFSDSVTVNLQTSTSSSFSSSRQHHDQHYYQNKQHRHIVQQRTDNSCLARLHTLLLCLSTPAICVTLLAGVCGGIAVGTLELLLPTFFYEEFKLNPFHQSLFYVLIPVGYWVFSLCASYYADHGVRYKALASGLCLMSCGFLLFIGVAKSLVLVGMNLLYIGGCLGVVEMTILPLLHTILEWLDLSPALGLASFELSESALLLGLAVGPLVGGGTAMAVGGGIWGFQVATFLVGAIGVACSIAVLWALPKVGRVVGASSLDVDGSLFGVEALKGMHGGGSRGSSYSGESIGEEGMDNSTSTPLLAEKDFF